MNNKFDPEIFSAMQEGVPIGQYVKTVPSKVHVIVLNSWSLEPTAVILQGEPGAEESIIKTWSVPEDIFLRQMNRRHFSSGFLKVYQPPVVEEKAVEETIEQASDETLLLLINGHFKRLESSINKTDSEAVLFRMIKLARENEKSERLVRALETRLAEIQNVQLMGE